ncbi:MAG: guanine deaminase [Porticoccaceae bacterium]|nr:guanine deaminase [Porticoccaceae bacterium]
MIAHRGEILHFLADPDRVQEPLCYEYFPDGLLVIKDGVVQSLSDASQAITKLDPKTEVIEHKNSLIMPGFVDTHIHFPQTEIIAAYGEQLLQWLDKYTFPTERKFEDKAYARNIAEKFLNELLRAGTTTALVFGTVHKQSVEAFFEACEQRNLRMIAGKVMMDRNAPDYLTDCPESSYQDSKSLIEKWHNRGRLRYAVTPRFSPTSSYEQLQKAGQLMREYPDIYMHTHLSENLDEVAWVKELFPDCDNYLATYDRAGLLGRRSVFAHCIHLCDSEWQRMVDTHSGIAFCPTSNLFLGSGLFNLSRAVENNINVGMGTDVGGGTSFSILQTLNEAYKVVQLRGQTVSILKMFYLATLGGAKTLDLDDKIGNFEVGKEADLVVLDKHSTPLMELRLNEHNDLLEQLFVLSMLGDDRTVKQTWSAGTKVHDRDQ